MGKLVRILLVGVGAVVAGTIVYLIRENHYDKDGYNSYGYNREGRDRAGFDREGFDIEGYDSEGFDRAGWDRAGYSRLGYDKEGYDKDGRDQHGYDKEGYDYNGRDRQGFDRFGYCPVGIDRSGMSRRMAEETLLSIEELKEKALEEMNESSFREALTNIRTGIDHCVILLLKHKTGKDFDDYDSNMQSRIDKCQEYKILSKEEAFKCQEARRHGNSIHELRMGKEYNQVYFCFKTLEEMIMKTRSYLDIVDPDIDGIQLG